jgi:predicted O-methyltransferase YrrM
MPSMRNRQLRKLARRLDHYSYGRVVRDYLGRAGLLNADQIQTFTTRHELCNLMELALACPDNASVLEIGSYLGASACYIAAGLFGRNATMYCVDTWNNETMPGGVHDTFTQFKQNLEPVWSMIRPVRKRSADLTAADLKPPFNLAFLDGDHSYDTTHNDFRIVSPMMAPDGVIALHDTKSFPGVARALGEILCEGRWRLDGHVQNLTWLKLAED